MKRSIGFFVFASLAIGVGLYPLLYLIVDGKIGLLESKTDELLASSFWSAAFYTHIIFGGLALITGWSQFNNKLRLRNLELHRKLGSIYCVAVLFSGLASLYLAFFATGGLGPSLGFGFLGLIWLSSTFMAYSSIREKKIIRHQKWMIISYAACFAAVTLRIWLPLLTAAFGEFLPAYRLVAWLCWVPNILIALLIIRRMETA